MTTVGEILAAERRRQGKSIADVVEGTKIRSRLLDALEQGNYNMLPSPAYVKGYIQNYARYLEIPAGPLLEQFKRESADVAPNAGSYRPSYLDGIPAEAVVPRKERAHEIPRRVWVIVAVGGALILLILCIVTFMIGGRTGANTNPTATPGAETTATSPGAAGPATTTVVTTEGGFKLRVSVRAGLASFVKVTYDGLTGVNGTMQDGQSKEWLVTQEAEITVGKPDAVVVTRDGQPVTIPSTTNAKVVLSASE
jgi:transcriptional regulator with XRE-family HTH domain